MNKLDKPVKKTMNQLGKQLLNEFNSLLNQDLESEMRYPSWGQLEIQLHLNLWVQLGRPLINQLQTNL